MRVLVIDEALPFPPDSGKRIRTWELLRRLAGEFEIVLAFHQEGSVPDTGREACDAAGISLLPVERRAPRKSGLPFAWDLFRNLFCRVPYMVMAHRSGAMRHAVREAVAMLKPDLIHVEWTPLVGNVRSGLATPVCIAAHNVETRIWERYRETETSPAKRAYIALQLAKLRRFERRALGNARAVIAVSEGDAREIRAWSERVTVVPNGVDTEVFAPRPGVAVEPESLLFTGSLDWRPNQDAVTWFLDAVWPRVREERPGARFSIVGRNPPPWLEERARSAPGVALHASVPEIPPYVARAALCIVPLRIGGGSRLKIPEALAMEKPVVSTTVGAEGLDLDDTVTLADGAEAFAAAVVAALHRPQPNPRGRALVCKRYDWSRLAPLQAGAWRAAASEA